ncbi:MAG: hypothetical protein SF162_08510 [bacterium]|nr:hypothetical protein [bacterium]
MSRTLRRFTLIIVALFALAAAALPIIAGSDGSVTFASINVPGLQGCYDTPYVFKLELLADTDDGDGEDHYAYTIVDANGTLIFAGNGAFALDLVEREVNFFQVTPNSILALAPFTRPFVVRLIDLQTVAPLGSVNDPDVIALINDGAPVLSELVFDPASVNPDCESIPLVGSTPFLASLASFCPTLPSGSIVGALPNATRAYYRPGDLSTVTVNAGTYWVIGVDESAAYYKIMIGCQFLWLPVETMQPSFQAPWSGQPLPTRVVG